MVVRILGQNNTGIEDTSRIDLPITILAAGTVPPAPVTTATNWRGYGYTINDDSVFQVPIALDWEQASTIAVKIRWACNENYALANGEVRWRADWETVDNLSTQVIGAGTTGNANTGDINIPTTANQMTEATLVTIAAASLAVGDTVDLKVSRIALGGGANPTAEPVIYAIWVEYTRFVSTVGASTSARV